MFCMCFITTSPYSFFMNGLYFQKRALTRFDARDILGLFRRLDLGAIKCFEWFQIKLWPPIAPH
ncbi:MAG: hypothetical protein DRR08_24375 [Candidatus Parabeggiatoa sp. nov. 2]|nr:MAG: hypothetical protein B6247_11705 [Beggiatoa sp. 4572_84]RKZ55429.1 MAG: hypothetical protein DRR08_24375 [Gammaproteobacteria bacterium]